MTRLLIWTDNGWDDYLWWQEQDKKTLHGMTRFRVPAAPEHACGKAVAGWRRRP